MSRFLHKLLCLLYGHTFKRKSVRTKQKLLPPTGPEGETWRVTQCADCDALLAVTCDEWEL